MIGQSAPIGEPNRFVEHITSLARRVRELELTKRPFIQVGRTEITTAANGLFTITFPIAFPSTDYSVAGIVEAEAVTASQLTVQVNSRAVGSVQLRLMVDGNNAGSGVTRIVHWQAIAA